MSASPTSPSSTLPGRAEQFSTRVCFFVAGFTFAAWAPIVPYVKDRTDLGDSGLGLLLLCLGGGSVAGMPLAGWLSKKYGCRLPILFAVQLVISALPVLSLASSLPLLALALFVCGVGLGTLDCVMNIQAIIVERASGRAMMSGFHGLFSLGGLAGAGLMTLLLSSGLAPFSAVMFIVSLTVAAMAMAAPYLLPYGAEGDGAAFAIPHGVVLLIGLLCFVVFMTEGSVLDWSAVFLTSIRNVDPSLGGLAYAAFSLTMTICRLTGDAVVERVGRARMLLAGPLCAAIGLFVVTLVPSSWGTVIGFGLVGVGCANVVPILFTAIGRQKAMPEHVAVPAVTMIGYLGILAGPAAIGFIAHAVGLLTAFILIAVLLLAVAAGGRFLRVDD
ncbi:MFS transporter [Hyphomicrobium sp.]|uniref:MFS transporter n=1 Tax=Hyphomicrobium sp. TaxID=82 RepID=UPI002D799DB8|nr:MFS transporter [Hyphomicrobium sp.]HET6390194.1 MFS transporter [Hyphomicrobium sp.]